MPTLIETADAIDNLKGFIPTAQLQTIGKLCKGEEGEFFRSKLASLAELVDTMAKTYEQEGKGDDSIVYLHYFTGPCDWYIIEKDVGNEQHQTFGLADLGYGGELGYISLVELCAIQAVEIDLHFTPVTLGKLLEHRQ